MKDINFDDPEKLTQRLLATMEELERMREAGGHMTVALNYIVQHESHCAHRTASECASAARTTAAAAIDAAGAVHLRPRKYVLPT